MKIQKSAEDYLETILILGKGGQPVRSIDIATALSFSKPSVSVAMKNLRENGYITVDGSNHIALTKSGREIAETIYERHMVLTDFLEGIGVDNIQAAEDACKLEHAISPESFAKLKDYVKEHF